MKALLSVSDKRNLVEFARRLLKLNVDLIASGGTARTLKAEGLPVTTVEEYTGSPEILEGRVKTLHPKIFAGILARDTEQDRADLARIGAEMIDLVVVNLYPFRKTIAQPYVTLHDAIEFIDIGGVALLRAAAKNFHRVAVVCDPNDYELVLRDLEKYGSVSLETREVFALKAFAHTAEYDASIRDYLLNLRPADAATVTLVLHKVQDLRYGENPHQHAALYSLNGAPRGPLGGKLLQGKELSYNNLLDLDAAWQAVWRFDRPATVIVKHLSPCGIAMSDTLARAFQAALASDPVSAFGSILAFNRILDGDTVRAMGDLFIEAIVAPGFTDEARALLSTRKNCRVVEAPQPSPAVSVGWEYRTITGGILRQSVDMGDPAGTEWRVVTHEQPTEAQMRALRFAWQACQPVRSNAIVIARLEDDGTLATVGIGGGQPNRVDSVRLACERAGARAQGAVLASDAFFPFADSIEVAARAGVVAIVQPGGSVRDAEVIEAANRSGIAMIFTGVRHFRH